MQLSPLVNDPRLSAEYRTASERMDSGEADRLLAGLVATNAKVSARPLAINPTELAAADHAGLSEQDCERRVEAARVEELARLRPLAVLGLAAEKALTAAKAEWLAIHTPERCVGASRAKPSDRSDERCSPECVKAFRKWRDQGTKGAAVRSALADFVRISEPLGAKPAETTARLAERGAFERKVAAERLLYVAQNELAHVERTQPNHPAVRGLRDAVRTKAGALDAAKRNYQAAVDAHAAARETRAAHERSVRAALERPAPTSTIERPRKKTA